MLDTSTVGRGQLNKNRSINVEANLLSQRALERDKTLELIKRRFLLLGGILVLAALLMPALVMRKERVADEHSVALLRRNGLAVQLATLDKQKQTAQPMLKDSEMQQRVSHRADRYLGRILEFYNSCQVDMVISQTRVEVIGGEMKISARADAKDYSSYEKFIARLQKVAGNENVVPKSTRSGRELGDNSVVFDILYRTRVQDP